MLNAAMTAAAQAAEDEAGAYRARLIGSFDLTDSAANSVLPRSRRASALLAYLILAPQHEIARDALAALLWSERGDEQARASLRQTLFELRPLVGADRLVTVMRTTVHLNGRAVTTDLAQFDRAVEHDDLAGTIAWFGEAQATLLVSMRDLDPAFDEWLAHRRAQWREKRRTLALQACHGAGAERAPELALELAQLLAQADPLDEAAAVAVMNHAHCLGDIATIRRAFAALAKALRRELDVAPGSATASTYERLVASAAAVPPTDPDASSRPKRTVAPPARAPGHRNRVAPGLALVLVAAGVPLAYSLRQVHISAAAPREAVARVPTGSDAVVTIQPLSSRPGDLKAAQVRDGLASAIVRHLTGSGTPVQIADTVQDGETSSLTIRGNALDDHGVLRANIQLIAYPSNKVVWAGTFVRAVAQLDQFEEEIGIQIARELHCAYADGRQPYVDRDPELARLSLSHCDTLGHDSEEAVHYDWQITRRAPTFARGWAEYAMDTALISQNLPSGLKRNGFAQANNLARHALALDPHQGLAYSALVVASQERPWPERLALVRSGLAADPTSPELYVWHSFLLAALGRQQDARGEAMVAYRYDHLLPAKLVNRALAELASGDVDDAQDDLALARTYWPRLRSLDRMVVAFGIAGVQPERALKLVKAQDPDGDPDHAAITAFLAWRVRPTRVNRLTAAAALNDAAARDGGRWLEIQLLALLGRFDDAYRLGDHPPPGPVNPGLFAAELAPFRRDPRFMPLMRRAGVAAVWQRTGLWPDFCAELGGIHACDNAVRAKP